MEFFDKEITFLSKEFIGTEWVEKPVIKVAKFKEFSRTDKDQHKLHFMMISLFESGENDTARIDSDKMYDITVKAVKTLLIIGEDFNDTNKNEFLNDSGALFSFGMWLFEAKIIPFFSNLMSK